MTAASGDERAYGSLRPNNAPRWVLVVGAIMGCVTMLYLMGLLAVVLIMRIPVETYAARFLSLGVFAMGIGMSSAFLGGYAAMNGRIHLPFVSAQEHPLRIGMGGGILSFIITLLLGARIWPYETKDSRSQSEHVIEDVAQKVVRAWGEYESITDSDSILPREGGREIAISVKERAVQLASDMLSIDESDLGYSYLLIKWQYTSYAYCIAASLESDSVRRLWLAQRTSWASDYALALLEEARARALKGKAGYRSVVDFVDSDYTEGRIRYLIALGLAIRQSSMDSAVRPDDVRNAILRIPASFQRQAPPKMNPWLAKHAESVSNEGEIKL